MTNCAAISRDDDRGSGPPDRRTGTIIVIVGPGTLTSTVVGFLATRRSFVFEKSRGTSVSIAKHEPPYYRQLSRRIES